MLYSGYSPLKIVYPYLAAKAAAISTIIGEAYIILWHVVKTVYLCQLVLLTYWS